ncbi:MAG: tetratricopeptide repeat protein [Pseudomarimonas sp.]
MTYSTRFLQALLLLAGAMLIAPSMVEHVHAARRQAAQEKPEPMFPLATREDRAPKIQARFNKQVQALSKFSAEDKFQELIDASVALANDPKAKPSDVAIAYQNAAYGALQLDDLPAALGYLQKAIDADALSNDTHYQLMLQVAQIEMGDERYTEALTALDRFLTETKSVKPEYLALKGNALYRLDRFAEAAEALKQAIETSEKPQDAWQQLLMAAYFDQEKPEEAARVAEALLARNPDDKRAAMNLASIYAQGDQFDKASATLEGLRAKGLFSEERDYRQLYSMYLNMDGREAEAISVINEGLSKGLLKESGEVYTALAQAYYFTDKFDESIVAYQKAAPLASDGEAGLNLARVLSNEERFAESKAAAQAALAKGLKKPGEAWMTIARSELGLNNKTAAVAAYKEAAKFPETKQQAEEGLRQSSK